MERADIGKRLKMLREESFPKGQSYADFEIVSGVSRGSIKNIEDGISYPRLDILEKWLLACGTDISLFFSPEPKTDRHAELERRLAFIVRSGEERIIGTTEDILKWGVSEIERARQDRQLSPATGRRGRNKKQSAA